ncbi:MAG TPA: hypothetical protein VJ725_19110 [Thermoanaerobaculia bacterium]|nr:hypothetical protein [Thermoanaerobaculia bacterium]
MRFQNRNTLAVLLLAALAGGAEAQTYDLRGPAPAQGTIVQTRSEWKRPQGTFTIEQNGQASRARSSYESVSVIELEALQTEGRELKMARYTVPESWWQSSVEPEGFPAEKHLEDGPMTGETVLLERRDDGWQKTLLGREPNEEQKKRLRALFVDENEIYPKRPVAIGESWTIEGPTLANLTGNSDALSVDGKMTCTLDRVIEEGGDRVALISYRMELRVKWLEDGQTPFEHNQGGSGQIRRSLKHHINLSDRLTGQEQYTAVVHANGRTTNRTEAGAFESVTSQRIVTASNRAAVVRRGQPAPSAAPAATSPAPAKSPTAATATASCKGTALPCVQRNEFNCGLGSGCIASGLCTGTPTQTCFGKPQATCATTPGCFWQSWSKSCAGVPTCLGKPSLACKTTLGCRWQSTCAGNAQPCSSLDKLACGMQPGCVFQ